MYLSEDRFSEILHSIAGVSVAVIGDVMLDRYLWGDAERISPEAPVPVIALEKQEIRIGGAANVADNLAVFGVNPVLISAVGGDESGEQFLNHAKSLELDVSSMV